jgi:ribosomal RNA-processing protein 7
MKKDSSRSSAGATSLSPFPAHAHPLTLRSSRNKRKHDEALRNGKPAKRSHKKKKTSELKNFYSFQIKEQKMKQLDILRKKFEENKSQIQRMREQRKFNPF